ncbi:hypothetical protein ANO14919_041270 [Xylariales sp. No.14919]|nr:hypothetical protein ANO14919_041270 [Xylariales sp. No.14919]
MGMSVEYTIAQLEGRAESCELCALFLKVTRSHLDPVPDKVRFDRRDSYIDLNNTGIEPIQLLRDPDTTSRRNATLGLPNVPNTSREVHFEIIRQWLWLCDDEGLHPDCGAAKMKPGQMPTRLIDVGADDDEAVRVWEPGKDDHQKSINLDRLPAIFRNAILTARAIGKRYLWIDLICILQGPERDFYVEARRMEAVFSSAYCVLAASRAHNQRDGFLGPRRERDYVAMYDPHRNVSFFLCENIDAFDRHVLGGHLHKRGWVLQEHALARRTIFVTKHQTYFECSDSVRLT